jgi:hypothetical protein
MDLSSVDDSVVNNVLALESYKCSSYNGDLNLSNAKEGLWVGIEKHHACFMSFLREFGIGPMSLRGSLQNRSRNQVLLLRR